MIAPSAFSKVLMPNFLLHAEKSRKGGNVTKDTQQHLFALKTHTSVIQVYTHRIKSIYQVK